MGKQPLGALTVETNGYAVGHNMLDKAPRQPGKTFRTSRELRAERRKCDMRQRSGGRPLGGLPGCCGVTVWYDSGRRCIRKNVAVVFPKVFNSNSEERGDFLKAGFIRCSLTVLPRRPLLWRHAKCFGALRTAATAGELFHAAGANIGGYGEPKSLGNFPHMACPSVTIPPPAEK